MGGPAANAALGELPIWTARRSVMNYERFVESAPKFKLPPSALDHTVGWSSAEERPLSLLEFIAARAPRAVTASFGIRPHPAPESVKRVAELTDEELKETVTALLRQTPKNIKFAIGARGAFSTEELIEHVKADTELGLRLTAAAKGHIDLLERLIEAGKLAPRPRIGTALHQAPGASSRTLA